jgi:hypothetical protein
LSAEYPYLTSVKNLPAMLEKIKTAGAPPKFTHEFLKTNLGFSSSSDRTIVGVLKKLGFLTADGTPTARYNEFRDTTKSGRAMAVGLREGWAEIFLSDQLAYTRSTGELTGIFKSVTGKAQSVASKMAATFKTLASVGDWKAAGDPASEEKESAPLEPEEGAKGTLNLHHDIHIHLPATSDVATYTAIFRALREELL